MIHVHVVRDANISSAVEERRKLYVKRQMMSIRQELS